MRLKILVFTFSFLINFTSAQDALSLHQRVELSRPINDTNKTVIFYDHDYKRITKTKLATRTRSQLFYQLRIPHYDTVYYINLRSYAFGRLDVSKKRILFDSTFARHNIDTTKIISIHYRDTLKSLPHYPKDFKVESISDTLSDQYLSQYKNYLKIHENCSKNSSRNKNGNIYHFFNQNLGGTTKVNKLKWYKDYNLIVKNMFGLDEHLHLRPKEILIRPDGSYFLYFIHDSHKIHNAVEKLFKNKNWDKLIEEYNLLNKQFSIKI